MTSSSGPTTSSTWDRTAASRGGTIVTTAERPEEVACNAKRSYTGQFLRKILPRGSCAGAGAKKIMEETSKWKTKINLTMLTDFYELTMANGYFEDGHGG